MEIKMIPYYYKFNDINNTIYDLQEIKGLYIRNNVDANLVDMDLKTFTEYLIIICVGILHTEINLYYKDEEIRDKDYVNILEILTDKKLITEENV